MSICSVCSAVVSASACAVAADRSKHTTTGAPPPTRLRVFMVALRRASVVPAARPRDVKGAAPRACSTLERRGPEAGPRAAGAAHSLAHEGKAATDLGAAPPFLMSHDQRSPDHVPG